MTIFIMQYRRKAFTVLQKILYEGHTNFNKLVIISNMQQLKAESFQKIEAQITTRKAMTIYKYTKCTATLS